MNTISTEALSRRMAAGPTALFDVRGDIEYEEHHIPGARTAPLGSLVFRVASLMNPDSLVVVYGQGPEDGTPAEAVTRLRNLRMRNVVCYLAGVDGWVAAGLPLVASPAAKVQARGPVTECRPVVVDRERAYGGAFLEPPSEAGGAGG